MYVRSFLSNGAGGVLSIGSRCLRPEAEGTRELRNPVICVKPKLFLTNRHAVNHPSLPCQDIDKTDPPK
jgi:hypothetical protein